MEAGKSTVTQVKLEKPKEAQGSAWNANVRATPVPARGRACAGDRAGACTPARPYARGLRAQPQRQTQTQTHAGGRRSGDMRARPPARPQNYHFEEQRLDAWGRDRLKKLLKEKVCEWVDVYACAVHHVCACATRVVARAPHSVATRAPTA